MARTRTDKSAKSHSSATKDAKPAGKGKKASSTKAVAQKGGDNAIELVTDLQEHDPALGNDVSAFLNQLKKDPNATEPTEPAKASKTKASKPSASASKPTREKNKKKNDVKAKIEKSTSEPAKLEVAAAEPSSSSSVKKGKFIVEPVSQWYTSIPPLTPSPDPLPTPTPTQLSELSARAEALLASDAKTYQASAASTGNSAADSHFLQTILTKGTLSDRLSALTLLVQASPVHNSKALETLKGMAERGRGKGGRDEGLKAVRCVVDWWVGGGAPNRKLRYFRDQPLLHPDVTDQHLVLWFFEDWLKKYFFAILQILETYSLDPLDYVRTQTLSFISTLLRDKPEQEQNLLRLLVNKLGDTEKAVCSRTSYHLLQILQAHPNMKGIIVREVKALIFKPVASTSAAAQANLSALNQTGEKSGTHIRFGDEKPSKAKSNGKGKDEGSLMERWNTHAWYYAAVTLNQIVLSPTEGDRTVARVLIGVYFDMFEEILGSRGNADGDAAGDDAAQPHGKGDKREDAKGKSGRRGPKDREKGKQKAKESKGAAGFTEVEDESSRMMSAVLSGVNRALPFAKVDGTDELFKKHIDTLFLITHTSTFNISLQALMLILQIITSLAPSASGDGFATSLADRFYRTLYSSLVDSRLSESNKQAMYLNLIFKALKFDSNIDRVKAFVRRFIQVITIGIGAGGGGTEFAAGGLYLLGELCSTSPALKTMFNGPVRSSAKDGPEYDPRKRDPQYASAGASPVYEILPLLNHYHPTISLHARQLLTSAPLTASPDLSLNTLSHFLDRFVYKNPKKARTKGASAMQPAASKVDEASGVMLVKGEAADPIGPVNDEKFWTRRVENVPVDEVFFHKFFTRKNQKAKEKAAKAEKRKTAGGSDDEIDSVSDDEEEDLEEAASDEDAAPSSDAEEKNAVEEDEDEENSDAEEAEIWKAMKASMPAELDEDDDLMEDSDSVPSDLDSDDEEEQDARPAAESDEGEDFELAEASDAEDLLPLDADVPTGLIEFDGSESENESEEWGGLDGGAVKKRKRGEDEKSQRKKLKSLPTFASYEDYAKLIEDGPEDNI